MAELWTWVVVLLAPVIVRKVTEHLTQPAKDQRRNASDSEASRPSIRAATLHSPYQVAVLCVASVMVLISVRNLIPVRYGLELLVPEQVVASFQRTFYTVYTSPSPTVVDPLRLSLRGGYESDLFFTLDLPITVPSASLRSLLASAPSLLSVGFQGSEAELQSLLARLSSYDGRKLYLLVGARPLIDCAFCHASRDYLFYARPQVLLQYAWRIMAFGFITASPTDPVALLVKRLGRLRRTASPEAVLAGSAGEADRKKWRAYTTVVLLAMFGFEFLVMSETVQLAIGGGRWSHWHANLHVARQLLFATLALVVFFFPAHPRPTAFQRTAAALRATHAKLEKTLANLDSVAITREVIWRDEGLVHKVAEWHLNEQSSDTDPDCDAMMAFARKVGVDVPRLGGACSNVTESLLQEAEFFNRNQDREKLASQLDQSIQPSEAAAASVE